MIRPKSILKTGDATLTIGQLPRIVGTLSSFSPDLPTQSSDIPCDVVEVRLDEISNRGRWLERCQSIEATGLPVILTLRLRSEGGNWQQADQARLGLFKDALEKLSCVDVEFKSEIAAPVSDLARRMGKACIVSYHDFEKTLPFEGLCSVIRKAQELASIVKLSTMVRNETDVETLRNVLQQDWRVPICVIGMGPLGTHTRVTFSTLGSCLTYGYLDKPSAPGQLSAERLVESLRNLLPKYNEDFIVRKQVLEYA